MADGLPLAVRDLQVIGDEGRPIVSLGRLDVPAGGSLGIRGPSGAGKTTLLFAIAGLLPGVRGRIAWGNTDIVPMRASARRAFRAGNMGLVFQDFLLFDELQPVANAGIFALFAPRARRVAIRERAATRLREMGVPTDRASVRTLSGGERQRVSIARALSTEPAVLLADEPTAALHREAADRVIGDLTAPVAGGRRTLVVASHDERLLGHMDRVIELGGGGLRQAS